MGGGDPRRQIGEERRDLAGDVQTRIDLAHARKVLVARLLREQEPRAQRGVEHFDRRRHDLRHDARALAAAEHQQAQQAVGLRRGDTALPRPRSRRAAPDCRCASPWRQARARRIKHAVERGRDRGHARRQLAVGAADHGVCSWMTVGILSTVAAPTGGSVG